MEVKTDQSIEAEAEEEAVAVIGTLGMEEEIQTTQTLMEKGVLIVVLSIIWQIIVEKMSFCATATAV